MEYLRIDEDGSIAQIKGSDPENDQELLAEVCDNDYPVIIRYRGNQFEQLVVDDVTAPEEEDEGAREFDTGWEAV